MNILGDNVTLDYHKAIKMNTNLEGKQKFRDAYKKEIEQLRKMKTWDEDALFRIENIDKKKIINSMFIFNTKRNRSKKMSFGCKR